MTTEEFLAELQNIRDQFEWTLGGGPGGGSGLNLRATLRGSPEAVFDPLAAVCYMRTGKVFETRSWPEAARTLVMDPVTAARVLSATNDPATEQAVKKGSDPDLLALRELLLRATGAVRTPAGAQTRSQSSGRAAAAATAAAPGYAHARQEARRPAVREPAPVAARKVRMRAMVRDADDRPRATSDTGLVAGGRALLPTVAALARSVFAGIVALVVSAVLCLSGVLYVVGLSVWAARQYGMPAGIGFGTLVGRPSVVWLIGLVIFGAACCREYRRASD